MKKKPIKAGQLRCLTIDSRPKNRCVYVVIQKDGEWGSWLCMPMWSRERECVYWPEALIIEDIVLVDQDEV